MSNKLGIQDLALAMSERYGMDQKSAITFVKTVFEIVEEYVATDKLVKIKGFGTFKLTSVSDRESVNVNTGERIVIAGHTKLSFTPDAALRDAVNLPFSDFETTPLNEATSLDEMERVPSPAEPLPASDTMAGGPNENEVEQPLMEVVEETVLDEIAPMDAVGETAAEETAEEVKEEPQETPSESEASLINNANEVSDEPNEVIEDVSDTNDEASSSDTEVEEVVEVLEEPAEVNVSVAEPSTGHRPNDENPNYPMASYAAEPIGPSKSCGCHKWVYTIITIVLMALAYVAGHYRVLDMVEISLYSDTEGAPKKTVVHEQEPASISEVAPIVTKDSLSADTLNADTLTSVSGLNKKNTAPAPAEDPAEIAKYFPQVRGGEYWIVGDAGRIHYMQVGETLYKIAQEELGDRNLVRYLIVFNDFDDPNVIHTGDPIRIPKLVKKVPEDIPGDDIEVIVE